MAPGGRGGLGSLGVFGTLIFKGLGGLGILIVLGLAERLRAGAPTREVGMGIGDIEGDSQSDSVKMGESGFGGGRTSPGTVTLRLLCRGRLPVP
jgi:hypothetical protein